MLSLSQPHPLTDIVASVDARTPIGSAMRTADWQAMPAGLRDQAFFSASVESVRFLQRAKDGIAEIIARARAVNDRGEAYWKMDRPQLLAQLRRYGEELAIQRPDGRDGGKIRERDITDPLSVARLRLIINTQIELAYGKADWLTGMDPDILAAFPAWELVRVESRMMPRDWPARWKEAGGELIDAGRMVALKTDPIWKRLSRFGNPHPPFDFNSGMGVEDLDRSQAEELGLIGPDDELLPNVTAHQESLSASLRGLQTPQIEALKKLLGPRSQVTATEVTLPPVPIKPPAPPAPIKPPRVTQAMLDARAQAFSAEFGCRVAFQAAPGRVKWGARMSLTAAHDHLQTVGDEWRRLRAAFPQMAATPMDTFLCIASKRGRAHVDGPAPQCSTKAQSTRFKQTSWDRIQAWDLIHGRAWTTERPALQVEDNFRHELGHVLSTPQVMTEFRRAVLDPLRLTWFRANVSEYAATKETEALAELFGICTRADYVRGSFPAEVEAFIFKFLLGE